MKTVLLAIIGSFIFSKAQAQAIMPDYTETGRKLPPGVPKTVDTNGNLVFIDGMFTTKAYQEYACDLLLKEANQVAQELRLPDELPITRSNLVGGYISPFGFAFAYKKVGNISTTNYSYGVEQDYKFSDLTITKLDDRCRDYAERYQWPISQFDTNSAFQLATQWLATVHMDVARFNRYCDTHVDLDPYWNGVKLGELPKQKFTPIYFVSWTLKGEKSHPNGSVAYVELFLPTKTLLSLSVNDSKYISRQPLAFTNLAALFPGKGTITTNHPLDPKNIKIMPAPPP